MKTIIISAPRNVSVQIGFPPFSGPKAGLVVFIGVALPKDEANPAAAAAAAAVLHGKLRYTRSWQNSTGAKLRLGPV